MFRTKSTPGTRAGGVWLSPRCWSVFHSDSVLESWADLLRSKGAEPSRVDAYQSMISGRVLPGESLARAIWLGSVDVSVCYCSVYDQCWVANLQDMIRRGRGETAPLENRETDRCGDRPRSAS